MSWWAIDVRTAPERRKRRKRRKRRERIGAWLVARTGQAVEERDDGTLVTFAPDEASADALVAELSRAESSPPETSRRPLTIVLDPETAFGSGSGILAVAAEFLDGDAGDVAPLLAPADLLLSNILRKVNTRLLPAIVTALRPGGVAIFSGMEEAVAATRP